MHPAMHKCGGAIVDGAVCRFPIRKLCKHLDNRWSHESMASRSRFMAVGDQQLAEQKHLWLIIDVSLKDEEVRLP